MNNLIPENQRKRTRTYLMMVGLVFLWGYEYVAAKYALEILSPMNLIFLKYVVAVTCLIGIKIAKDGKKFIRRRDLPCLIISVIFGEIFYYVGEYSAMSYMPVALITIVIAFTPALSVIIERVVYKSAANLRIYLCIGISIFGVGLVVGADFGTLFEGRIIGYLFASMAVFSTNIYNFLTARLAEGYTILTLALNQLMCTMLMSAPFAIGNLPPISDFTPKVIGGILYLGIISAAICFLIYVNALSVLGVTPVALFSNFIPVTATLCGWFFLGEVIAPLQFLGGAIVVSASCLVLREKGRLDKALLNE